jgi:DNA-binding CsgD family transcriptional regulator
MRHGVNLNEVIDRIHGAALDPGAWSGVVGDLARLTGGHTGIIYDFEHTSGRPNVMGTLGIDPAMARAYEEHFWQLDPWHRHALTARAGAATLTHELIRDADFQQMEFYQDHLRLHGIFYALGVTVDRDTEHTTVFGVQRGKNRGPFSQEAADMVEIIAPHLRQAHRMQRLLREAKQACATLEDTLHQVTSPVIVVDGASRLHFANRAAEAMLARGDGLRLKKGVVSPSNREQSKLFAEALAALATVLENGSTATRDLALQRPTAEQPIILRFALLPRNGTAARIAIHIDPPSTGTDGLARLSRTLRLTGAETRLLGELVAGASLAEIAERHAVSINTLRVQLHRLFQKTGTHRQSELLRFALMNGGPDSERR